MVIRPSVEESLSIAILNISIPAGKVKHAEPHTE